MREDSIPIRRYHLVINVLVKCLGVREEEFQKLAHLARDSKRSFLPARDGCAPLRDVRVRDALSKKYMRYHILYEWQQRRNGSIQVDCQ